MAALRTAILKRLTQSIMTVSRDPWAAAGVAPLLPSMRAALESHGFSSLVRVVVWVCAAIEGGNCDCARADAPICIGAAGLPCFRAVASNT